MTTLTDFDQFTDLRGNPDDRPTFRSDLREDLRAALEEGLRSVVGPLTITKSDINKVMECEGKYVAVEEFDWNVANARGTLAHKAIELHIGGLDRSPGELVKAAIGRHIAEGTSLARYLKDLSAEEQAELTVAATDYVIKYREMFPVFHDAWWPNAEASTATIIGKSKRVLLRGKIDLKLGTATGERSNTILIDWKTGHPSFTDFADLRFYALLETLRTGVPPFRLANTYLNAGQISYETVSEETLWTTVDRVIEATLKIAALNEDEEPKLNPGNACRFCPAMLTCSEAVL